MLWLTRVFFAQAMDSAEDPVEVPPTSSEARLTEASVAADERAEDREVYEEEEEQYEGSDDGQADNSAYRSEFHRCRASISKKKMIYYFVVFAKDFVNCAFVCTHPARNYTLNIPVLAVRQHVNRGGFLRAVGSRLPVSWKAS